MSERINWIDALPEYVRQELLHDLSITNEKLNLIPLEINETIYWIPPEVNMLIEVLKEDIIQTAVEKKLEEIIIKE